MGARRGRPREVPDVDKQIEEMVATMGEEHRERITELAHKYEKLKHQWREASARYYKKNREKVLAKARKKYTEQSRSNNV